MNPKSVSLIKGKTNLEERTKKMLAKKAQEREAALKERAEKEEASMGAPAISSKSRQLARGRSSAVDAMYAWEAQRVARLQAQKEQKEEEARKLPFRPELSARSEQLFRQFRQTNEPVEVRLLRSHDERQEKGRQDREFSAKILDESFKDTFRPSITGRAQSLHRNGPTHERLFADSVP